MQEVESTARPMSAEIAQLRHVTDRVRFRSRKIYWMQLLTIALVVFDIALRVYEIVIR